jgi:hypothetical protein
MSDRKDVEDKKPESAQPAKETGLGEGLTDDERVSRASESEGEGANVELGPADLERLPKP